MIQSCKQPVPLIDFTNQTHRKIALEFQLKMLQLYGPTLGIYALPNLQDQNIWDGIIFIRSGYYKDGKFKFTLHLQDFPTSQPKLYFKSAIYHPLINQSTGQLDVSSTLSQTWNYYSDNMIYSLMKGLKKIFTEKQKLANSFSFNSGAANLYENNIHEYITKAMESVNDSIDKMSENQEDCVLNTTQIAQQDRMNIKEILGQVISVRGLKIQQKVQLFLKKILQ